MHNRRDQKQADAGPDEAGRIATTIVSIEDFCFVPFGNADPMICNSDRDQFTMLLRTDRNVRSRR